jgi:hypothetical protein
MLRKIIALIAIFTVFFTGFNQPAFAANPSTLGLLDGFSMDMNWGNRFSFGSSSDNFDTNSRSSFFSRQIQNFVDAAVIGAEGVVGGAAVCYTADAAATTVFPPAALLAPFCPVLPTLAGGTAATAKVAIHAAT